MNTDTSNDLVSISVDTLARVTGGNGPGDPGKKDMRKGGISEKAGAAKRVPPTGPNTGATIHNGGGNSDYYY